MKIILYIHALDENIPQDRANRHTKFHAAMDIATAVIILIIILLIIIIFFINTIIILTNA